MNYIEHASFWENTVARASFSWKHNWATGHLGKACGQTYDSIRWKDWKMSRVRKQKSYLVPMLKHLVKPCSSWLVKGLEMRGTNTCFVKVKFNMQDSESWTFERWKLRKVECSLHLLYSLLLLPMEYNAGYHPALFSLVKPLLIPWHKEGYPMSFSNRGLRLSTV